MRLALAALLALAPAAARAADVPGSRATRATLSVGGSVSGVFETVSDADWYKIKLYAGHDYALTAASDGLLVAYAFRDTSGHILTRDDISPDFSNRGFEFRAPYNGYYFVSARLVSWRGPPPFSYALAVLSDCRADATTRCRLADGGAVRSATASVDDKDWFAATLAAGVTYVATLAVDGRDQCVTVEDANGNLLTDQIAGCASFRAPRSLAFTVPASGRYFLDVWTADDYGSPYALSLTHR